MKNRKLYTIVTRYLATIEAIEKTHDRTKLMELEEARALWHNRLIDALNREGIAYKDREHVTAIAYNLRKELE